MVDRTTLKAFDVLLGSDGLFGEEPCPATQPSFKTRAMAAMRGRIGRVVMAVAFGLALLVPGASLAADNVGPVAVLDPSFGDGGLLKLPPENTFSAAGTATQDGTLIVSGGSSLQLVSSLGGTGQAFGGVGSLTLPAATGDEFDLGGFTIDPRGRLLVVGTSLLPEAENTSPHGENGSPAFRPSAVRILRFLPDGELDPAFGRGGVVETDFALPAPLGTDGRRLGSHPAIEATDIAVGPLGQIVVTGSVVVRVAGDACKGKTLVAPTVAAGYVARFTEDGVPDPGFGRGGLVGGRAFGENPLGSAAITEPVVGPSGRITYRSIGADLCVGGRSHLGIGQLRPDGRTRTAFGKKGAVVGSFRAVVGGPDESVIALAGAPGRHGEALGARLTWFSADGKRDTSFGKNGEAKVKFASGSSGNLDSLAVDSQGRFLVGGTLGSARGRAIALLRVSAEGKWEMGFGPHGRVATRVPHLGQGRPSALFFDPLGRLVTVHLYNEPLNSRSGLTVARYLLRN